MGVISLLRACFSEAMVVSMSHAEVAPHFY